MSGSSGIRKRKSIGDGEENIIPKKHKTATVYIYILSVLFNSVILSRIIVIKILNKSLFSFGLVYGSCNYSDYCVQIIYNVCTKINPFKVDKQVNVRLVKVNYIYLNKFLERVHSIT